MLDTIIDIINLIGPLQTALIIVAIVLAVDFVVAFIKWGKNHPGGV